MVLTEMKSSTASGYYYYDEPSQPNGRSRQRGVEVSRPEARGRLGAG